jgi:DMSO/TMAO reductase YedYZ molybdopterin-dependent catalytic subunit
MYPTCGKAPNGCPAWNFLARDHHGYWEQAGYHNEADVWKEQRFAD